MDLTGKVVLISGAARGMGAHEARRCVAAGARVILGDVQVADVVALAEELGPDKALAVQLDVSCTEDWTRTVSAGLERFGRIDVLVNNAGILRFTDTENCSDEEWEQVLGINLGGGFKGIRAVIPAMKEAGGGSIVNISSTAGLKGFGGVPAYIASKFGMRGLTKAAAIELAPYGIRVNSVHPGNVETEMIEDLYPNLNHVPMKRVGQPDEIANLVIFLASDASSFSTGSEFVADGGETGGMPDLFADGR
ncbi:SDR family NAD(P)-dependent oxidoreductase [Mangrovicoccus ximenensis]|uniref:SDR family NAD(P)-dependent oxidoreductase n=1 Tax=Mangrovicoccus ximenensis TaxID=1911570 RepID=UPI000D362FA6|nr:glucose 1-dehydrogenase [Mangrovicoccus ximenensis]